MARIRFEAVGKRYPNGFVALNDLNLDIADREFLVLLGPSGCGKSTTLNMIAGLEEVTEGRLLFDERLMNAIPPHQRDVAMVFQSYALYPHKSVYENVAFGLKMRKYPREEIDQRVREAARRLEIEALLDRRPDQLSGGQRQRVALGRAMVRQPQIFLMDEPLSNLDAALRISMRAEIKQLHQAMQTTFVYVTHDQAEALTLADRVVVMRAGIVQQIGPPAEIYEQPANMFVAGFLGNPAINFIEGTIESDAHGIVFVRGALRLALTGQAARRLSTQSGRSLTLGLRAEDVVDDAEPQAGRDRLSGRVLSVLPVGSDQFLELDVEGCKVFVRVAKVSRVQVGEIRHLRVNLERMHLFDPASQLSVLYDGDGRV